VTSAIGFRLVIIPHTGENIMGNVVAVAIDGVWQPQVNDDAHHAITSTNVVDQIVVHLGEVVRLAQSLSPDDQRRVRDFCHATSSMLLATTYLPKNDQRLFETTLREIAKR
jgi:hypothetical protein